MSEQGNGEQPVALPASRAAAVEQAALYYQEMAARNEELVAEVAAIKAELAGYKISLEVMTAQRNDADSKTATAMIEVDAAKAARAEYESLYISMQALFRAFKIPAAPLVRALKEVDDAPTIGGS